MHGRIRSINTEAGYGFVRGTDNVDRFFHKTRVAHGVDFESLKRGDQVEFDEDEDGPKGPRAKDIELA